MLNLFTSVPPCEVAFAGGAGLLPLELRRGGRPSANLSSDSTMLQVSLERMLCEASTAKNVA